MFLYLHTSWFNRRHCMRARSAYYCFKGTFGKVFLLVSLFSTDCGPEQGRK